MRVEKGQKCVVVGLGASGMAAVRFLREQGAQVLVSECRDSDQVDRDDLDALQEMGVTMECGGHTTLFFQDVDLIVPSPGVPLDLPVIVAARKRDIAITGELALVAGRINAPVIGVTGSNGKTTVTSLIGHLLQSDNRAVFVGGNIGIPVLEYICGPQKAQVVVLELSSFQLEICGAFRPDIGLLLNISPDHLERHGSMERYAALKRLIFVNQTEADTAILGADDGLVMAEEVKTAGTVLRFGLHPGAEALVTGQGIILSMIISGTRVEEQYDLQGSALASNVNRLNAAAAILAVRRQGCSQEAISRGLATFVPPPHRMVPVAEIEGVTYVDDSKGTNTGAVAAALASCGDRVILIAGGRSKGSDFSVLESSVVRHVRYLVLIGEAAEQMEHQLGSLVPAVRATSMEDAVHRAAEIARPGDTVLLSPACASFDMFSSYGQRGDIFQQAVRGLRDRHHDCC